MKGKGEKINEEDVAVALVAVVGWLVGEKLRKWQMVAAVLAMLT